MKHIGFISVLIVAIVGVSWVAAGDQSDSAQKACAAKSLSATCGEEANACADKTACCGKCGGTVAAATPKGDCGGCGPVAALAKDGGDLNVDVVRLDRGVALVFVTSDPERVPDLQKAILAVNTNVGRAASAGGTPDGLCRQCTGLIELTRAGARARVENTSSGAVVVLTGSEDQTVRSLQAWADGLKQAATAMRSAVPQAG